MSIRGAKHWNLKEAYFIQENNPTEHLLKSRSKNGSGWLETCGPTAAVNCLAAMGLLQLWETPGGYAPQPEQELTDFLNDPRQFNLLKALWSGLDPDSLPGNEVAEWYPAAVENVFGVRAHFLGSLSPERAIEHLGQGQAVQVCLIQPGHFVALVAYDDETKEFIVNDSWSGRWPDKCGWNKRMCLKEYQSNLKPKSLVYSEEKVWG